MNALLQHKTTVGALWHQDMEPIFAFVDIVLRIAHKELYEFAEETQRSLRSQDNLRDAFQYWQTVYNGVSLISNRDTPAHVDANTHRAWPDVLVTAGPYRGGTFKIGTCERPFKYSSGTVVLLCGGSISHEVIDVDGERVCWAFFMRKDVQRRIGWEEIGWASSDAIGM